MNYIARLRELFQSAKKLEETLKADNQPKPEAPPLATQWVSGICPPVDTNVPIWSFPAFPAFPAFPSFPKANPEPKPEPKPVPKPEPKPEPKVPYNRITISLKTGPNIVFEDTDPKFKDKPHKTFKDFVKWYTNPKSKRYYIFSYDEGLRMILKSEITTFDIRSIKKDK